MVPRIEIELETCDREGLCVQVCWEFVFEQTDQDSFPIVKQPANCIYCGHCIAVCPSDAITIDEMDTENFRHHTTEMDIASDRLLDFVRMRRSVRNYKKRPVERALVDKLIEAGRYAPTGGNAQSLAYIIVDKDETKESLALLLLEIIKNKVALCRDEDALATLDPEEVNRLQEDLPIFKQVIKEFKEGIDPFFYDAPIVVVVHADPSMTACPTEDAAIASYQMMLMAHSLGLGTCYIHNLYEYADESGEVREILDVPPDSDVLIAFAFGYPEIPFRRLVDRYAPEVNWIGG
jgi:nitroreductase/NAD-dependent dihydropyrimidine dehydrogenase PreA subunit